MSSDKNSVAQHLMNRFIRIVTSKTNKQRYKDLDQLVKDGFDVNSTFEPIINGDDYHFKHSALWITLSEQKFGLTKKLLEHGADPNSLVEIKHNNDKTPLIIMIAINPVLIKDREAFKLLKLLIKYDTDIGKNITDKYNRTVLDIYQEKLNGEIDYRKVGDNPRQKRKLELELEKIVEFLKEAMEQQKEKNLQKQINIAELDRNFSI